MNVEDDDRRGRRLAVGTLASTIVHVLLGLLLTVLSLGQGVRLAEQAARHPSKESDRDKSVAEYPLVVSREGNDRPVHERPLEAAASPVELPKRAERRDAADPVARPRLAPDAAPIESPSPLELPRAAAAAKSTIETPSKLSRQDASRIDEQADAAEVELPKSLRVAAGRFAAAGDPPQPASAPRRPVRVAPKAAVAKRSPLVAAVDDAGASVPRIARKAEAAAAAPGSLPRSTQLAEADFAEEESSAAVEWRVVLPTPPPAVDGPPEAPPSGPNRSRSPQSGRSAARSRVRAVQGRGRSDKTEQDPATDAAFAAMLGGLPNGLEGSRGRLDASSVIGSSQSPTRGASGSPVRAPVVGDTVTDGIAEAVAEPADAAADEAGATEDAASFPSPARRGSRAFRGRATAVVTVRGPIGAGGSEDEPGPQPGVTGRPNRRPIDAALENDARFLARVSAAALPVDGRVREVAAPFARRRERIADGRDPSSQDPDRAKTEAAIERSLDFLARCQRPDGRWSLAGFPGALAADAGSIVSDSAATGLALLCFLGAGYDHFGEKHADTVRRGLGFLRAVQRPDGDLYLPSDEVSNRSAQLYSHAIATMAVCEAVGMTGDPILKQSAEKACRFIETAQHAKRGGWRYAPGIGSDLSVSGWMLLALRSGQLAGVRIDPRALEGVRVLLDTAQDAANGDRYVYNPFAPDTPEQRAGRAPSPTMTAVGLLMRLHTGWNRDDPRILRAAVGLAAEPVTATYGGRTMRDCYMVYYAAQVIFHVGGEVWNRWYAPVHGQLVASQKTAGEQAGSWDPGGAVPDRWGGFGGRIYVTALNVLTLEVGYRHLPIYEVLSGPDRADGPPLPGSRP